jgi:hypothetical protein
VVTFGSTLGDTDTVPMAVTWYHHGIAPLLATQQENPVLSAMVTHRDSLSIAKRLPSVRYAFPPESQGAGCAEGAESRTEEAEPLGLPGDCQANA